MSVTCIWCVSLSLNAVLSLLHCHRISRGILTFLNFGKDILHRHARSQNLLTTQVCLKVTYRFLVRIPLNLPLWLSYGGTRDVRSSKWGLSLKGKRKVHKSWRQIAGATKFCTEAANICRSWMWYFMSPFWRHKCWICSWILENICAVPCYNKILKLTCFKNIFYSYFDIENRLLTSIW